MGYSYPEHAKLLPFCQGAPRAPHPSAWLVGITQIAHHLGTNTRQARKKIACGEVFAIEVDGVLYGNRTWCPNTWYAGCAADPNDPGFSSFSCGGTTEPDTLALAVRTGAGKRPSGRQHTVSWR